MSQLPGPLGRTGRVRDRGWVRVARGLYRPDDETSGPIAALHGWSLALPDPTCFTHLTAAEVRGWAVPPLPASVPVFASSPDADLRRRRPGLLLSRHAGASAFDEVHGLRLAKAPDVLLAAARDLGLVDLVVLLDSAMQRGDCTREEVAEAAARRRRGAPALRRALALADERAESAWESLLRLLHVLCDVPVHPQYPIDGGRYRADLRIVGTRRLAEYDGEIHRDRNQHLRDLARDRQLQRAGWQRFGYSAPVVLGGAVSVLRDADDALARPHEPSRIRVWHDALSESLFTPAGTARVQQRWAGRG